MIAAVRDFLDRSGAMRVTVLLDLGDTGPPALIDVFEDGTLEVEIGEGQGALGALPAPPIPDVQPVPPLLLTRTPEGVDLPLVQLAYLAGHVRTFAQGLGGRSVATAHFASTDPETPVVIAAREGDPLLVVVGEEQFPLPPGWPD